MSQLNNNLIYLIYHLNIFYTYKTPARIRVRILAGVFAIISLIGYLVQINLENRSNRISSTNTPSNTKFIHSLFSLSFETNHYCPFFIL